MSNKQQLDKGATIKKYICRFPTFKYWNNYKNIHMFMYRNLDKGKTRKLCI